MKSPINFERRYPDEKYRAVLSCNTTIRLGTGIGRYKNSILLAAISLIIALFVAVPQAVGQAGIVQEVGSVTTEAGPVVIEEVTDGLNHPWGLIFLPDGRLLVTERSGNLRIIDMKTGSISKPVQGTPTVYAQGQGGLLDVALDPDFEKNRYVYLSFSQPGPAGSASTALGRGQLKSDSLANFEVIFSQEPKVTGPNHFGGRIVFSPKGHLFLTMGERFQFGPAQDSTNHLGTIVRLNYDGTVPKDNPFTEQEGARDEIWSYGHRNIESAAINPETGALWIAEMGPLGGDELNIPEAGKNYGWPEVSWGQDYDGEDIPNPSTNPTFADAAKHWTPVISPSGMIFYTGDVFPEWQGTPLIGSLTDYGLVRIKTEGGEITGEERIPMSARIRAVAQGPDGLVYVLTDKGNKKGSVWRLRPLEEKK